MRRQLFSPRAVGSKQAGANEVHRAQNLRWRRKRQDFILLQSAESDTSGFHEYLKNRSKPWKHEELAAKMIEIVHEDECNDTYGRERMHKALLLKYGIYGSEKTTV